MTESDDLSSERRVNDPDGWIKAFEAKVARALVGERIQRVQYREIDYGDGQELWSSFENFEMPDYGVELFLSSGRVASVIWASHFFLGLEFIEDLLDEQLNGNEVVWDVSVSSRWRGLLDVEITSALIFWDRGDLKDTFEVPVPIGFSLRFESGAHTYLAYGEYFDDDPEKRGIECVTVFFDDDILRRYGIDPEKPTKFETTEKDPSNLDSRARYVLRAVHVEKTEESD